MRYLLILLLLCSATHAVAQNNKSVQDLKTVRQSEVLLGNELMEYVNFVQDFSGFQPGATSTKPMIVKLKNHHPTKKLLPRYIINGKKYSDDGLFNDKIAGDGVFTSVENVTIKNMPKGIKEVHNYSNSYSGNTRIVIKFGCKVRLITCPESSWWNSCYPMSSPCQCVEFYDCEFEISL